MIFRPHVEAALIVGPGGIAHRRTGPGVANAGIIVGGAGPCERRRDKARHGAPVGMRQRAKARREKAESGVDFGCEVTNFVLAVPDPGMAVTVM